MQKLYALLIFIFSSGYVVFLDYLAFTDRGLQKSIVIPFFIMLIIIYRAKMRSWKTFIEHKGKWMLLFWGTVLVQTLVIATGGLQSPFLILLHLFMIGLSFLFSFAISQFFLLFSVIVIFYDISLNQNIISYLSTEPSKIILQLVSLFSIIPLAYIISQQYHLKAMLSKMLISKVKTDQVIFENLEEMIIITDDTFHILSVNDSVEKTLQKPRSELRNASLFSVLLLKDANGNLVKQETFFPKITTKNSPRKISETFTIVSTPTQQKNVTVQIQTIKDLENKTIQFSFIFNFASQQSFNESSVTAALQKTRTKYEALYEQLKQTLFKDNNTPVYNQMLLVEKLERDLYNVQTLPLGSVSLSNIDVAVLCKQLVIMKQSFAQAFKVPLTFTIQNFGHKDIEHLTVEKYAIQPENFTGPFFTILCDAKRYELLFQALLDIAVFLASSTSNAWIKVELERKKAKDMVINIKLSSPRLQDKEISELFTPNYGALATKTNLQAGSGLEGYLAKMISEKIETPVTQHYESTESILTISWNVKPMSEAAKERGR